MSPEPSVIPSRRIIRSTAVSQVAALSFPTIVEAPKPVRVTTAAPDAVDGDQPEVTEPTPVIDPAVLEEARLEAAARGYQDGFAAGRDEAIAAIRHEAQSLLSQLDTAVRDLETRQQRSFDQLSDDVARFALATVEAILDRELALADNPTRDAIDRALRVAPDRLEAIVVVHPDDVELLGSIDELAGARNVEVTTDSSIERAGCIVRVAECEVDAQLGRALERLRSVLQISGESDR